MNDKLRPPTLADITERLKNARLAQDSGKDDGTKNRSAVSRATHIGVEMIAGVVVGGVLGWALDKWLGTAPWLLVVMLFLGFGAGVLNAARTARLLALEAARQEDKNGNGGGNGNGPGRNG